MKKLIKAPLTLACASLALAPSAGAQPPSGTTKAVISAVALRRLDSLFHYLDTTGFYNGNILVAAGGEKVAGAAIGYANLATGERLTDSSTFELASLSKQFTAVGILRLVDAGKLALDQKLETIFPAFPYKGITMRNLLNHTGGLPDYGMLLWKHRKGTRIFTNADVISMLTKYHPVKSFEPGTKWEYSNTGYAVLASVIEKISGRSYAEYMQEAVFTPLHLAYTQVYMRRYAPRSIKGYAYGYVAEGDNYTLPDALKEYSYVVCLDGIAGDGAVNATVGDLLLWNNALRDQKLLSPALWNEALTPPLINGVSTNYGFGLMVTDHPQRGRVLMHNGAWPGYKTRNVLYLDKDVSLIYLSNKELAPELADQVYEAVRDIVFDEPARFPTLQVAVEVDKSLYRLYEGTYESTEMSGFALQVRAKGGHLFVQATGQGENEVIPESQNKFFVQGFHIAFEFLASEGNPASALLLHQNGIHEFRRKP